MGLRGDGFRISSDSAPCGSVRTIGRILPAHFFLVIAFFSARLDSLLMNWQRAVEDTVTGLGYDLVDAEKSAGGLLRVFIDHVPPSTEPITVDDCEKVTRQLQHVLEAEGA